jgi:thiopurine S-methyltransferase
MGMADEVFMRTVEWLLELGDVMNREFWLDKWRRNEIGFHEAEYQRFLLRFWPRLGLVAGATVLVPLCGKSLDLLWLARQGHRVVGVELSALAVEAFFSEHGLEPQRQTVGALERYRGGDIEIWQGDFFALTPAQLPPCAAFYDRAALIALPRQERRRYARHLMRLLAPRARGLVITLDYQPDAGDRPPFSVGADEIGALYGEAFDIETWAREDVLALNAHLAQRGLTRLEECAYRLMARQ